MKAALISGGEYSGLSDLDSCDFIIACDKGYEYCLSNNIRPDLLIGDFDSYQDKIPEDIETIKLPVIKDDTDTMYAYRKIVSLGFDEVYLYCALGGRLDHTIANIQCAIFGARHNIETTFISENETIIVTYKNRIILEKKNGRGFSLFAADQIHKLSIHKAKYEVTDISLSNDFPLGQSNCWLDEDAIIEKDDGALIIVESKI